MHFPIFIAILSGALGLTTQTVLLRQYWLITYGNEWVFGIGLTLWLLWGAAGCQLAARAFSKTKERPHQIILLMYALALALPLALQGIQNAHTFLNIPSGEIMAPPLLLLIAVLGLALPSMGFGALFPVLCSWMRSQGEPGRAVRRIYLWEAAGAGVAGLGLCLWLLMTVSPHMLLCTASLLLTAFSGFLHLSSCRSHQKIILLGCIALLCVGLSIRGGPASLENSAPGERLASIQTPYNQITARRFMEQTTFYLNRIPALNVPNRQAEEESVHPALLIHPVPKSVLLLGTPLPGSIDETLKHPSIEEITVLERDPAFIALIQALLPNSITTVLQHPKVKLITQDPRRFLGKSNACYDLIILNLPLPVSLQLNRFYTQEFYQLIHHRLQPHGILALNLPATENLLNPEQVVFFTSLQKTLKRIFTHVHALPGESLLFLAGEVDLAAHCTLSAMRQQLERRQIDTRYIRLDYLRDRLSPSRTAQLQTQLNTAPQGDIYRDLKPRGYRGILELWAAQFPSPLMGTQHFSRLGLGLTLLPLLGFLGLIFFRKHKTAPKATLHYAIFTVGFTEMALQIMIIQGYQLIIGQIYTHLALLSAGYMGGIALGAASQTWPHWHAALSDAAAFRWITRLMVLLPPFFTVCLTWGHTGMWPPWVAMLFFVLTACSAGFLGGAQFPLANQLITAHNRFEERTAGRLYSLDLIGAAVGALAMTLWLLPTLGYGKAALFLACINACTLTQLRRQ